MLVPLARVILKFEIKRDEELLNSAYKKGRELRRQNEIYEDEIKSLNYRLNRIKSILKENKNFKYEIALTKNEEIVFISYKEKEVFDSIYLHAENGENQFWDSQMMFKNWGEELRIEDFLTRNGLQNKGYGRALMEFVIKKAKELGIKNISGNLSHVDKDNFPWLLPFYESFGFSCTFDIEPRGAIIGKAYLSL